MFTACDRQRLSSVLRLHKAMAGVAKQSNQELPIGGSIINDQDDSRDMYLLRGRSLTASLPFIPFGNIYLLVGG